MKGCFGSKVGFESAAQLFKDQRFRIIGLSFHLRKRPLLNTDQSPQTRQRHGKKLVSAALKIHLHRV